MENQNWSWKKENDVVVIDVYRGGLQNQSDPDNATHAWYWALPKAKRYIIDLHHVQYLDVCDIERLTILNLRLRYRNVHVEFSNVSEKVRDRFRSVSVDRMLQPQTVIEDVTT